MIPGMNHCTGGEGAYAVDYLKYLEAWVERGQAPDHLLAFHPKSDAPGADPGFAGLKLPLNPDSATFSRPVFPYPITAKYLGRGDPSSSSSFSPDDPP